MNVIFMRAHRATASRSTPAVPLQILGLPHTTLRRRQANPLQQTRDQLEVGQTRGFSLDQAQPSELPREQTVVVAEDASCGSIGRDRCWVVVVREHPHAVAPALARALRVRSRGPGRSRGLGDPRRRRARTETSRCPCQGESSRHQSPCRPLGHRGRRSTGGGQRRPGSDRSRRPAADHRTARRPHVHRVRW